MKTIQFECLLVFCTIINNICHSKPTTNTLINNQGITSRKSSRDWIENTTIITSPGERTYSPQSLRAKILNRRPLTIGSIVWFENTTITTSPGQRSHGLKSLLEKVHDGRPLTMVVIGGSNSAGGGIDNPRQMYYNQVADWWNNVVSSNMTVYRIPIGGTGSDFFLFCLQNFLSDQQPDIVLLETAVNDNGYKYGKAAQPMELLTRRLLLLPSKPLVMYVNLILPIVDPKTDQPTNVGCLNMQNLGFDELTKYYGIPSFSLKDVVCPLTSSGERKLNATPGVFAEDKIHVAYNSHAIIASIIINYLHKVLKEVPDKSTKTYFVPTLVKPLFSNPSISDDQLSNSMCWSHLTPNWKTPLRQTLDANVTESRGFRYISPKESRHLSIHHTTQRTDAYAGWQAKGEEKERYLKFRFHIPNTVTTGSVAAIFRLINTRNVYITMLLDDEHSVTLFVKRCRGFPWIQTYLYPVATNVKPGYHTLSIVSDTGENEVSGVVVGYSSYYGYDSYRPINLKNSVWNYQQFVDETKNCIDVR